MPFDIGNILRPKNTILQRCQRDEGTKARLKYNPWYHHIDSQNGCRIQVDGREMLMMSSNDYLGLSNHPRVIQAGQEALQKWGSSTTGSRLANGSRSFHRDLEQQLAAFLGKEDAMVLSAGYLACMGAVSTFAEKGDLILVDRNVHSSLWSGILLSGANVERFAHNNPSDLQDILVTEDRDRPKMVVVEGVYSMEGHIAPLQELIEVCRPFNCFFVVDDAHGLGVLGDRGQGTVGYLDRTNDVDVICGSLSKSMASTGGFIAGSKTIIEYLRSHSKQTIFSAAISPTQAAAAKTSLDILQDEPEHRERLWENTRYYKRMLNQIGANIWESETPAVPIIVGNKERAYRIWKALMDEDIFTVISIPPGVPPGKDLIRTAVSAQHTFEDLERMVDVLKKSLKKV
ncbi:aminotransferase class I/II-fold pyridoxal phosphate-dependent enzyme [Puniceicoccales bacterium CK1056]|uniref:Aminotransferase class I/II-fold pyridoxal phosphate-dependent enzyme n=1 Tax=Oceanipulchritudo coccoides TaxID=2706888 RepID=A0A6B2M343_9BACT|nr:aminotransferase class I/II-fold pyridoxal phosphate-dependent enzyme [Oceanipulchritudo coccoides]NDV62225.1 aminotransferase class I/II-fold pyridoxal phosphate-dependent enzyme [Oceanipulchritudo coccoides]